MGVNIMNFIFVGIFVFIFLRVILSAIIRHYFTPVFSFRKEFETKKRDNDFSDFVYLFKNILNHIFIGIKNKNYKNKKLASFKIRELILILTYLLPIISLIIAFYLK